MADNISLKIAETAKKYDLDIIYAFGSRAKEALDLIEGRKNHLSTNDSDLDIGIKPGRELSLEEKVEVAIFFEDLFVVPRVDIVVLSEAPVTLAFRIVTGEILYRRDKRMEAEYQLYIMRMMTEILPYCKIKQKMVLGI
jgi:predicted nucleotidyltransferase